MIHNPIKFANFAVVNRVIKDNQSKVIIMIKSIVIVGVGSFFGGALRYYLSSLMKMTCGQEFPWGTLLVNLIGCFLFGAIFALFNKVSSPANTWCLLLSTGVCGGFTTFSAFAHESLQMLQNGNISGFASYVALSVIFGLLLVWLGYWIIK